MPQMRITNLREFEARLSGGVKNLSKATFNEVKKEARKFFDGLPDSVERSAKFQELKSNSELRGKLGLATPGRKTGGDTDADDLIKLLRKYKVRIKSNRSSRQFAITFPSLEKLEQKLTHNLSRFEKGRIIRGRKASWFRWWEYGDRGEITSLTILRKTVSKLIQQKSGKGKQRKSRGDLLRIIQERSRSNEAIQLLGRRPDSNSSIAPAGLIRQTYGNYARIFPARMGKALKRIVTANGGRAEKFFARGVTL